ncbi:hypothetical protein FGIG_06822 [Fasciola gigantica]|uniref:Uncharacterized protein n=1 Tax=Fasciola gigantica TaxID=46835 RepID=A0A504YF37_FASGI|nr:hypothetical protein FGIG_06822 [Fasciola gigantica]
MRSLPSSKTPGNSTVWENLIRDTIILIELERFQVHQKTCNTCLYLRIPSRNRAGYRGASQAIWGFPSLTNHQQMHRR